MEKSMNKVKEFCVSFTSSRIHDLVVSNLIETIFKAVYNNPQFVFYSFSLKGVVSWDSLWRIEYKFSMENKLILKKVNLKIKEKIFIIDFFSLNKLIINSPEGLITIEDGQRFINGDFSSEEGAKIISNTIKDIAQCFQINK
jgi:hypothetical protein